MFLNLLGYMSLLRFSRETRSNVQTCFILPLFSGNKTVGDVSNIIGIAPCLLVFLFFFFTCPGPQNKRETMFSEVCCNSTVNMSLNLNSQATFGSRVTCLSRPILPPLFIQLSYAGTGYY